MISHSTTVPPEFEWCEDWGLENGDSDIISRTACGKIIVTDKRFKNLIYVTMHSSIGRGNHKIHL